MNTAIHVSNVSGILRTGNNTFKDQIMAIGPTNKKNNANNIAPKPKTFLFKINLDIIHYTVPFKILIKSGILSINTDKMFSNLLTIVYQIL